MGVRLCGTQIGCWTQFGQAHPWIARFGHEGSHGRARRPLRCAFSLDWRALAPGDTKQIQILSKVQRGVSVCQECVRSGDTVAPRRDNDRLSSKVR